MERIENARMQKLVEKAQNGDKEAFSEIVRIMMKPLIASIYRMTSNRDTALDLAQETFVTGWEKIGSFRNEANFQSWLFAIAFNKTKSFLNKSKRQNNIVADENLLSNLADNSKTTETKKQEKKVLAFMRSLPQQQRIVFDLRFYRQLSFNEIAKITERAVGTVKTNYREAIMKLRELAIKEEWRS